MPELPEVESLKRGLEKKIIKSKIIACQILRPKIISGNSTKRIASEKIERDFIKSVTNKKILKIDRLAKNIIITLENKSVLVVHLKMTGQLVFVDKKKRKTFGGHPIINSFLNDLPNKHTCIIFNLNNGDLYYNDIRMFGYVLYYKNILEAKNNGHFGKIGLEPFEKDFTEKFLREKLKEKRRSIKSVLLDQSIVNGCGNIYTDEICFASKISPKRICSSLKEREVGELYKNIKSILSLAIKSGGSSISDYLLADGSRGNYTRHHKVYGRQGELCFVCNKKLKKEKVSGRTTVFCTNCQK